MISSAQRQLEYKLPEVWLVWALSSGRKKDLSEIERGKRLAYKAALPAAFPCSENSAFRYRRECRPTIRCLCKQAEPELMPLSGPTPRRVIGLLGASRGGGHPKIPPPPFALEG